MNLNLENKNALVCGSTQGIGLATAQELALLGANITLLARNEKRLSKALSTLSASHSQQHNFLVADFSNTKKLEEIVDEHLRQGNNYQILINNTGGPAGGPITQAAGDEFENAFRQHLIVNQMLAQKLLPAMKQDGFGRIVNIISTSVKVPIPGLGVSNSIRGAVASWAKTWAGEVARFGITVNNVLPGFTNTTRLESIIEKRSSIQNKSKEEVRTAMAKTVPAQRIGEASETAAAVAFLCSPAAAYINGINLPVDGGRTPCL